MRSAEWAAVQSAIRERAFFSAAVEDVRFLDGMKRRLLQRLNHQRSRAGEGVQMDRARFISEVAEEARKLGVSTGTGDIKDVGGAARLGLIWDTQMGFAEGYARQKMAMDPDIMDAVPAQELVRIRQAREPRDWPSRWQAAGGKFYGGRMIALKTDPIWRKISRFDLPQPPFDFNSGMGLANVRRKDAEALGLLEKNAPVPTAPVEDFNEGLEASIAGVSEDGVRRLQETFGDYVKVDGGRIRWDAAKTREEPDELRALPVPERLAARRQEFARGAGAKPPGFPPSGWSQLVHVASQVATGSRPAHRDYVGGTAVGKAVAAKLEAAGAGALRVTHDPRSGMLVIRRKGAR